MTELLDIIQIPFVSDDLASDHFKRLDVELGRARAGLPPSPAWLTGVVTLRPFHQLEMQHSIRSRQGQLYCESRIYANSALKPPVIHPPIVIDDDPAPSTERASPASKRLTPLPPSSR